MAAKKRRCTNCKNIKEVSNGIVCNVGFLCSDDCRKNYGMKNASKMIGKARAKKEAVIKVRHKHKAKELRSRTEWYNLLQTEVNKYVRNRDIKEPCCTCGTTNPNIKYDAGHCFTRAARPDLRFNLHNLHRQCSVNCNQHGSGMRHEYQLFITNKYGPNHFDWLKSYHRPLNEEFPHWTDIEKEIIRYRKLNKLQEVL
jgi:hypothetical protein